MKICHNAADAKNFVGSEKKLGLAKGSLPELSAMQSTVKGAGFSYKKDFDGKGKDATGAPVPMKFEEWEK